MEVDMRGAENDEPEMSFRLGYQQGAIEVFCAIERFLDPATREVLQAWIEKDVFMWRVKAMLGHPPNWRLNMLYRVPEIVTRGRFPERGESDSTWRTQEARHVGSDTIAPGF